MKIAVDCRELRGQHGGFRTNLIGVLKGLSEIDAENEYILFCYDESNLKGLNLPKKQTIKTVPFGRFKCDFGGLAKLIDKEKPDVAYFSANCSVFGLKTPAVVMLHDCITLTGEYKTTSRKAKLFQTYSAFMTRRTVPGAKAVTTVSNYSKSQIRKYIPSAPEIFTAYNAVEAEKAEPMKTERPYFLALASVDKRKNTDIIAEAFALSGLRDMKLIVVASHPSAEASVREQCERMGISDLLEIRARVSDEELRSLYAGAEAFLFPSLDEGFGLPPLEAMAQGTAVISSDRTSMPEVLGDAALYFNPESKEELAEKMALIVGDEDLRKSLITKGFERVKAFSWSESAKEILKAFTYAAKK